MTKRAQAAQEGAQRLRDIPPVRCADLRGQAWSVPPGCLLYTQLLRDQAEGYSEHFVDIATLRALGGDVFTGPSDQELAKVYDGNALLLEVGYRQGQLLLLRERVKARG